MCHDAIPPGARIPDVRAEDVLIDVGEGEAMPSLLAIPERVPAPAVLMINGRGGRTAFSDNLARRLAEAGFLAIDPEFFFRLGDVSSYAAEEGRPAAAIRAGRLDFDRWPIDLDRAVDWLRAHPLSTGKVGTLGFCMGGTAAFLMAARRDDVCATVAYDGFVRGRRQPSPLEKAAEMRGPILGLWGAEDPSIPRADIAAFDGALTSHEVEHDFQIYDGLGHNFLEPMLLDGYADGHEEACASWSRALDRFGRALRTDA